MHVWDCICARKVTVVCTLVLRYMYNYIAKVSLEPVESSYTNDAHWPYVTYPKPRFHLQIVNMETA